MNRKPPSQRVNTDALRFARRLRFTFGDKCIARNRQKDRADGDGRKTGTGTRRKTSQIGDSHWSKSGLGPQPTRTFDIRHQTLDQDPFTGTFGSTRMDLRNAHRCLDERVQAPATKSAQVSAVRGSPRQGATGDSSRFAVLLAAGGSSFLREPLGQLLGLAVPVHLVERTG